MARGGTHRPKVRSQAEEDRPTDEAWSKAVRIAGELDKILASTGPKEAAVRRAARELRMSTRQVYNHLARYREQRRVSALLPRIKRPRRMKISQPVEDIIASSLQELWLSLEKPDLAPVVAKIRDRCTDQGFNPPSYVTVARRIPRLFTPEEIARRRHANQKYLRRLKPRPGYISADRPLDVVQIDHTPADIHFIEVIDGEGVFCGRAHLTIAADVATSAIMGFCLTLEKPSRLSVALCLAHAMCDKERWLSDRGINHDWPMQGRPRILIADSAKEFQSQSFSRSCADYGITIKPRNRGTVHRGGLVERLLGKLNAVLRSLPGKTGRSIADRDEYPSQERARLDFTELERCIALAIIDHNHSQNARKLTVPQEEWVRKYQVMDDSIDNPVDVLLNFLPRKKRSISPQGVSVEAIHYFDPWLGPLVARRDRLPPLELCYDPRDMSCIYLRDPDTQSWRPVSRRDGAVAPVTLWQHREERRRLRAQGQQSAHVSRSTRSEIADIAAKAKTPKSRLRELVRDRHAAAAPKPHESLNPPIEPPHQRLESNRRRRTFPIEDW